MIEGVRRIIPVASLGMCVLFRVICHLAMSASSFSKSYTMCVALAASELNEGANS